MAVSVSQDKRVRALRVGGLHRVHQHFDMVGEQHVVVVEEIEPFAAGLGERKVAGTRAPDLFARGR